MGRTGRATINPKTIAIAGVVAFLLSIVGCARSSEPKSRAKLEAAFKDEFGFKPPSTVTTLKAKTVQVGDTRARWLLFSYEPQTFSAITNQDFRVPWENELKGSGGSLFSRALFDPNPNAPSWWRRPNAEEAKGTLHQEGHVTNYHGSFAFIWVDAARRLVYVHSAAWD